MPFRASSADTLRERHGARYRWLVLLVVCLGAVGGALASLSFSVAIPALMKHFALGQEQIHWTMTGFMATMAIGMLPTPWLLDRFGFRQIFLSAIAVLVCTSVLGSLATDFRFVIFLRMLQGGATGVLHPLGTIAIMRLFPLQEQGRATGIYGFGLVLGPAFAPTLGGMLLDRFGWHAIFLINLPFCLLAGFLGLMLLPAPRRVSQGGFDWIGFGLLTMASLIIVESITSLQHGGVTGWPPWLLGMLLALILVILVVHARNSDHPLIDVHLFRIPTMAIGAVVFFVYGFGHFASSYLIPVFLQHALHYSATDAGVAFMPSGVVLALAIPVAGRMADRWPPRTITLAGLLIFSLSFALLGAIAAHITYVGIIAATILTRIGLGMVFPALSLATLRHIEADQVGQASVIFNYVRQLGGSLGIAIAAAFVVWREAANQGDPSGILLTYQEGFMMVAGVFLLGLFAACFLR